MLRGIKLKYIVIGAIALFLIANQGFRTLVRNYLELTRLKKQQIVLEKDKVELKKQLELLNTRDIYVERIARKELGLIKPGETEYRFPPPEKTK